MVAAIFSFVDHAGNPYILMQISHPSPPIDTGCELIEFYHVG